MKEPIAELIREVFGEETDSDLVDRLARGLELLLTPKEPIQVSFGVGKDGFAAVGLRWGVLSAELDTENARALADQIYGGAAVAEAEALIYAFYLTRFDGDKKKAADMFLAFNRFRTESRKLDESQASEVTQ